jgi:autoinducer 2-degrading protein
MIVLTAKYFLSDPADFDGIAADLEVMAGEVAANEPGCALYHASRSTERDDLVLLYEHYVDEAALAGHRETPHFKEIIEGRIVPKLAKRERELYELLVP